MDSSNPAHLIGPMNLSPMFSYHLSFQNFTLLSLSIENKTLLLKRSQFFLMTFHNPILYSSLASQERHLDSSLSYFPPNTYFQRASI